MEDSDDDRVRTVGDELRAVRSIVVQKYSQSFTRIFTEAMDDFKGLLKPPGDEKHFQFLFLAVKKMDCFIRRDWSRSVVDPPPFDKIPDHIVSVTAKSKQQANKYEQANKLLDLNATKLGRHLLDDVHKYGCLEKFDCEDCDGRCPVQSSRVSSIELKDWPTKRLVVPCVTAKSLDQPLYKRVEYVYVS